MKEKIKTIFKVIIKGVLELLYPKDNKCLICGSPAEGICVKCRNSIVRCEENEESIGYYKGVLKQLILKFKFEKDFNAGDILVELLEEKIKAFDNEYILTFIPVSSKTMKKRGFNQCEYLAREIAFRNNYKVINTLKKVRETKDQKTLSKKERKENLIGAFEIINKEDILGKKIILIDDVITTGATLREAKKMLKLSGVLQINTLTIAKTYI
ncbi:MAG: ComF family protein [Clostridium sp.]|uniref:ComF family protein n=1 Tax=Clostridium sp. DSM 8431 TaxID=1761781 RepID=UPI0008E20D40|nr:ComF family protein [Clostridium sp. DSM 8431]MCR4945202.1 ComF family protein [Clostridium sp.]SFU82460.1 competence protein ComFC [Clostridium sp. DSM 8431]